MNWKGTEEVDRRIFWERHGEEVKTVLVVIAGLHGNEPAGIHAVENMARTMDEVSPKLDGAIYAIKGNSQALSEGARFLDKDLNRMWETFYSEELGSQRYNRNGAAELQELKAIKQSLSRIFEQYSPDDHNYIFTDLHTTSSESCAFIPFNDTLANRRLARRFPVPQILGLEEHVHGTLLSYINNLGLMAIGFEGGAHHDEMSIRRCEAFLWLVLYYNRMADLSPEKVNEYESLISSESVAPGIYYEIVHHHYVDNPDDFEMLNGFSNFDPVEKDQPVAREKGRLVRAGADGRIFMPLYQKTGNDGFFVIREISPFWLELSAWLRRSSIHNWLKYLPGVEQTGRGRFRIDLEKARYLVRQIFHLLGYRVLTLDEKTLLCFRR